MKPPVFIVGSGGSGTTLLRLMLNAHPHLAIPPESNFVPEVWKAFERAQPCSPDTRREILRFLEGFPGYHDFQLDRARVEARLDALSRPMLSDVLDAIYREYAERHGKSRWGDKTPGYVEQLRRLNALFPNCLVIHLIRDGRDAALSMLARGVGPRTLYEAAREWVGRVRRGRRDGAQVLGSARYLEVYYERLVAEPRETLQRVCAFVGEPMDEVLLAFYRDASRHIPEAERQKHAATTRPVTTERVGRWERDMRLLDVLIVQAVAGSLLAEHGYALKRSPLAAPVSAAVWCRLAAERLLRTPKKLYNSVAKRLTKKRGQTPFAEKGSDPSERQALSVVIIARNEERRIGRCLSSVQWADEIIVVDGMSEDRTAEICRQMGARVVSHPFEGSFAKERNLGMEHARGEWVLQLDADDVVTPAFREAVARMLKTPQPHEAFKFRRKSFLMGRFMRHGGWYHELPNLVRRTVRYEGLVHERPVIRGTIGRLDADVEHHPCDDLTSFLDRHNRYTTLSAQELAGRGERLTEAQWRARLVRKPWKTFWKTCVKKQGFREGMHGLVFSLFFAGVELIKWAKVWERSLRAPGMPPGDEPMAVRAAPPGAAPSRAAHRETLSVVLMTKNEEARLSACLDQVVGWADEIVVIDDLSTDRTVEIARRYTDKVFAFALEDNHDRQWNRGIERATGEWVLHIDADEVVTPALREAIDRRLAGAEGYGAFELMRKNFFLGRPMRDGGWYHRHLVLFRRRLSRCVGQGIHVRLQVDGRIGFLDAEIEHYPFSSLAQFVERQNHYTGVEARVLLAERGAPSLRVLRYQLTVRPVKLFWKSYIKHRGRREGVHGLVFALLYAFAHVMLWAKVWQLSLSEAPPASAAAAQPNQEPELTPWHASPT